MRSAAPSGYDHYMSTSTERLTIEADGFQVTIVLHPAYGWKRNTKTRVYVGGEEEVDFSEAYAMQRANAEEHGDPFYPRGTFPEEDKLFARLNRQVVKNQKAVVEELRQTSEEADDVLARAGKLTFSRTAGCGCGCSPAFVPDNMLVHEGRDIESLFITKKKEN
ncbi:hypothetical protein PBI_DISMAS_47 [Microbacterium phage Dismas]|uniref:Uncharacterized protein n=1 Tax=Microbacterium phage Dismas TaxID=2065199 RepID=A0A2H5BFT5_9CAUD|nr:hypothetical protein FDJ24_gp47 [Microbacterium phage Dismas]AUG84844.1 hypothetical protein PBI_DISMAS_47 [Microbacterium phage Dismas]